MAYYVMSDIHGCFDEFIQMLEKINFRPETDSLFLCGDYIDRGKQSYEMLKWLEGNDLFYNMYLRGNHEEEFIKNIQILNRIKQTEPLLSICEKISTIFKYFDIYHTIRDLIAEHGVTLDDLNRWADMFEQMPLCYQCKAGGRRYMMVHAGYIDRHDNEKLDYDPKMFNLYARDEAYKDGGQDGTIVIAGHTPTIAEGEFTFNNGDVFRYEKGSRIFYDIDCGCVFRHKYGYGKLACMRLDDEMVFYV